MVLGKHFKSFVEKLRTAPEAASPWCPKGAPYPLLSIFDPSVVALSPVTGLVAIWHLGVRPQWLKIAATKDIAASLRHGAQVPAILSYRPNGEVYLAWAVLPAADMAGSAQYLVQALKPQLQSVPLQAEVALPPDSKPKAFPFPPGTNA